MPKSPSLPKPSLRASFLSVVLLATSAACEKRAEIANRTTAASRAEPSVVAPPPAAAPSVATDPTGRQRRPTVLLAGGDIDFGRMRGDRLVGAPERDDFRPFASLFAGADVRFANLESTISDRFTESRGHPQPLVFTAPPIAADALARGRIDVVSLANNHAWDFGESALLQTLANLESVGVAHAGAGPTLAAARAPAIVEVAGFRLAFIAVTSAWNQRLDPHPGRGHIADADETALAKSIRDARALGADRVIVSHHDGDEYVDQPTESERRLARSAIESGADVVLGHHPHVIQRIVRRGGQPVVYGLGNFLMRMVTGKPWTEWGMLARIVFDTSGTSVAVCPFRTVGLDPLPLAQDPSRLTQEKVFRAAFERLLANTATADGESALALGEFDAAGCAPLANR